MKPDEQRDADRLARTWNDLVTGKGTSAADADALADIRFIQELTAVPSPAPDVRAIIWSNICNRSLAAAVSTGGVAKSSNGVALGPHVALPAPHSAPSGIATSGWLGAYRLIALGTLAGLGAGFLSGLWARLAMRLAGFLTADRNRGLLTDNDAVVGQITFGGTMFLALMAAMIGMFGGVLYIAIRRWLPAQPLVRAFGYGGLLLAVFGFIVMDEHNPDYRLFGPAWLNVGTLSLTYVVFGVLVSFAAEWLDARIPRFASAENPRLRTLVALAPFAVLGVLGVVFAGISAAGSIGAAILSLLFLTLIIRTPLVRISTRFSLNASLVARACAFSVAAPALIGFTLTVHGIVSILAG